MYLLQCLLAIVPLVGLSVSANSEPISVPNQYVVKFTTNMPQATFDRTMGIVRTTLGNSGQVGYEYNFHDFQGFSFEAPTNIVEAVRVIPGVEVLHPNYAHHSLQQNNQRTEFDPTGYALDRISHRNTATAGNRNPPQFIYNLPDGQYTTIYVIDSGIRTTHTDFGGRAVKGANFAPNNVLAGHPPHANQDYTNHGTPVAALAAGTQYGAAKYANIIDVRIFNDAGSTSFADEVAGIQYAVNNAQRNNQIGSSVINFSVGGFDSGQADVVNSAIQSAVNSGMFVAVAAGNSRVDVAGWSPANVGDACTIGGTNAQDNEYYYTNYGGGVDLFAPGDNIIAPSNATDESTLAVYGTSFAAPLVAGVAAILKSYPNSGNTGLTPVQLCNLLAQTGTQNAIKFMAYSDDVAGPNTLLYLQP